jgi:hypothetical protein
MPNFMKKLFIALVFLSVLNLHAQVAYLLNPLSISAGTNVALASSTTNTATGSIDVSMSTGFMLQGAFYGGAANTNLAIGTGSLMFFASNSIDQLAWYRDPARDFTVSFTGSTTNITSFQTNFSGLSNAAYWKYAIGNAATNANIVAPTLQTGVKKGL